MLTFPTMALAQAVALYNATAFATFGIDRGETNHNNITAVYVPFAQSNTLLDYFTLPSDESLETAEWGDSIHTDPQNCHRIYFQNIDGLRNDADEMDLYISSMAQFQTGTFCWADHGLNMPQVPIQQKLKTPLNAHFSAHRSACSYSQIPPGPTALRSG
jgi:hypothetical protein